MLYLPSKPLPAATGAERAAALRAVHSGGGAAPGKLVPSQGLCSGQKSNLAPEQRGTYSCRRTRLQDSAAIPYKVGKAISGAVGRRQRQRQPEPAQGHRSPQGHPLPSLGSPSSL